MELTTQENYDLPREEICSKSPKTQALLESVFRAASGSKTGNVNYNKYGTKEGIGLTPVTEPFFDSFLLYIAVPDYRVTTNRGDDVEEEDKPKYKYKRYIHVGSVNSTIREVCSSANLKISVKAIHLRPWDGERCNKAAIKNAPHTDPSLHNDDTIFYQQVSEIFVLVYSLQLNYVCHDCRCTKFRALVKVSQKSYNSYMRKRSKSMEFISVTQILRKILLGHSKKKKS